MPFILGTFNFFKNNNIAALILAAILLFGYHSVVVSIQESKIERLERNNETLKSNQRVIETANESLQTNLKEVLEQQTSINKALKQKELMDFRIDKSFVTTKQMIETSDTTIDIIEKANKEIQCLTYSLSKFCFERISK